MPLQVRVSPLGLGLAFVAQFVLSGVAFALYGDGTTRGFAYSYVQPDDKTFAVWSVIYVLQLLFVMHQCCLPKEKRDAPRMVAARGWQAVNCLSAGSWLVANGAASKGFSYWLAVVVLWVTVLSVYKTYHLLGVDYTARHVSSWDKLALFAPVSSNLSWVLLAGILNVSNTLYDTGDSSAVQVGSQDWAIAVVALATLVTCKLAVERLDFTYAAVTIWALLGIHRNQTQGTDSPLQPSGELETMAISCIVVVFGAAVLGLSLWLCGASQTLQDQDQETRDRAQE
ncbi:Metabotropic glutamate receptor-like protein E, partial [Durusdinium trenchii]